MAELLEMLKSTDIDLRIKATNELLASGIPTTIFINELAEMLRTQPYEIKMTIIPLLGRLGVEAQPVLIDAFSNQDSQIRFAIVNNLAIASPYKQRILDLLVEGLQDPLSNVRWASARMLGSAGSVSPYIVSALNVALSDKDPLVRYSCAEALRQLGVYDARVIDALIELLDQEDTTLVTLAACSLRDIGPQARRAVQKLQQKRRARDHDVRAAAKAALEAILER